MHVIRKAVQTARLHGKLRPKNGENETKNPIYSFVSLDRPSGCYFATKLQENPRDLFVLALNECFVTLECLYFSVVSSQNKSTF